ncbi:MAG: ABC transporter permease [Bryobacteraceae bacterium]
MNNLLRDFRYGLRMLLKSPGATTVAVLALALGIGVNTSCFTWVNALVLHPLAYPDQGGIMTVWETIPKVRAERDAVAPANFFDWREQSRSFEHLAAYRPWDASLTGIGDPERIQACRVSPDFFALLGLKPLAGRTFARDEAEPARDGVVVVSQSFWRNRLGSAADALGKTVSLDDRRYTVVGVMPDDFDYPLATEIWAPLSLSGEEKNQRAIHNLAVLGRLKPQTSVAQARAEMAAIARRIEQQYPQTNEARGVAVVPLRELINDVTDRFVLFLLGAAAFVLLLACANIANLQLARATARQKEMAIRAALGAGRVSIARQLVAENILVALLGGGLGLVLSSWNLDWTMSRIPPVVLRFVAGMKTIRIDAGVALFTLTASLAAGVLVALPAVFQLLRPKTAVDLNQALQEGGRSSSSAPAGNRLRNALVVFEVSLALVLLVGAGLMVGTFRRLLTFNAGYNPKNLLTMGIALPASKYRENPQVTAFYDRVLQALETIPEVKAAGASGWVGTTGGLSIEGRPEPRPGEPQPQVQAVSEHYFQAMQLPVLRGRSISRQDGAESPRVVVLSETVAHHYWPGSNPIGQRIKLGDSRSPWLTVIGVSGDLKNWFNSEPMPAAYVPFFQAPQASMRVLMRTAADPMRMANAARAQVRAVDKSQPVYDVKSMEQSVAEQTSGVGAAATSMTNYAAIALLLAITGIYAVISYSVARRTHEIGVRIALGAGQGDVLKMVVGQASRMAGLGLAIGIPVAYVLARIMSSVLYNVVALDLGTFVGFTALLGASALLASYLPARRAARVDAMVALRHE